MKNGQLKVWWIPQVPMKPFNVLVGSLKEAKLLLDTLAAYDKFQLDNNIKLDYSNVGGLVIWDDTLDPDQNNEYWTDWHDDETGCDFDEYCEESTERKY